MKKKIGIACLLCCVLLTGCVQGTVAEDISITPMDREALFSNRDARDTWDEEDAVYLTLNNDSILIEKKGTYVLSGAIENGQIVVDVPKDDKVQLVLQGVSVHSESHAALYVKQADKVFITLHEGTENTLSSGSLFENTDENQVDAALFAKDDIALNGKGSLTLLSPGGHGIAAKDELIITGGIYRVEAASHGISAQDNICISGGQFNITAGKDGFHAEHDEDENLGFVYLSGGDYIITAEQDGISASGPMEINSGTFTITCGGGASVQDNTTQSGRSYGGRGGGRGWDSFGGSTASDNEVSQKGIKAAGNLLITGGQYTLNTVDDAIHSNASIRVTAGDFALKTEDDGIHADETLIVDGGSVAIENSYEGLEALHLKINGGDITLLASDDGLNAAGGRDESGYTGGRGGRDQFGGPFGMGQGNGSIHITGGNIAITAYGDGIDANGTFQMDDGYVTVCGPTQGDTATLDFDRTAQINGGTFIGTGSSFMAQTFSGGTQGVVALQVNTAAAGTSFSLADSYGKTILTHIPALDYRIIILSTPQLVKGEEYVFTIREGSRSFTAQ